MSARMGPESFARVWTGLNHPEGIVWDADKNLLYAGGERGEIYCGGLDGAWTQIAHCGDGAFVLGLTLDAAGNLFVCERGNSRVLRIDTDAISIQEISNGTPERPMECPNYPAFDSTGRLFVSDSGTWGRDDGVIFVIDATGRTSLWATTPSDFTNGIAIAPDQRFLYVAESRASRVWRIAIDIDGSAGAAEVVWHEPGTVPDGLAFDRDGRLYIGCYTPDSIYSFIPGDGATELFAHDWSGQILQAPTNLAFVGEGLHALATANLCGWAVNVTTAHPPAPGHPLTRPEVTAWIQ